jgi:hypothetical protein
MTRVRFAGKDLADLLRTAAVAGALAIGSVLVAGTVTSASANAITYSLTTDDCTGTCGTAPFGAVTLSSISATEVSVDLTLKAGEEFAVTGSGDALLFDITSNPSITVSGITSGFTATITTSGKTIHADGTGSWEYSIDCTGCGNGTSPPNLSGPLNFDVTVAGGVTPASFIKNGNLLFFATDIGGTNGKTGDVAAPIGVPVTAPVPEPASMAILGVGMFALGLMRRKRA